MATKPNQSVLRGVSVLAELGRAGHPVGSRELSRLLKEEHTRVVRLLSALLEAGMVDQDEKRRYHPGPGMHVLAAQCLRSSPLLQAALPVLRELHAAGHRVALGVLWRGAVSYLYHGSRDSDFASGLARLRSYTADRSSIGEVIEAFGGVPEPHVSPERRSEVLERGYSRLRAGTLRESLAVPVTVNGTVTAGLAMVGQQDIDLDTRVDTLTRAAAQISERIGVQASAARQQTNGSTS
jgi:DNA-binding IclR family transcriptional regulator